MPKKPSCCSDVRAPSASLPLEASVPLAIRSVSYWDEYAPWYKLWLDHTDYHHGIKVVLAGLVREARPDRVLVASERILPFPRGEVGPQEN